MKKNSFKPMFQYILKLNQLKRYHLITFNVRDCYILIYKSHSDHLIITLV